MTVDHQLPGKAGPRSVRLSLYPLPCPADRPSPEAASHHTQRWNDIQVTAAGVLLRSLHDATRDSGLTGKHPVVCHHDPGPNNAVFQAGLPVAFIDFDTAAGGEPLEPRIHGLDVVHLFQGRRIARRRSSHPGTDPRRRLRTHRRTPR
ncbi:MAG: phosphotransferase [Actinoallomurus sp.]